MFQTENLQRLAPRLRSRPIKPRSKELPSADSKTAPQRSDDLACHDPRLLDDPIAATEALAYDYLAKGGKYARPFITLAAYEALAGNGRISQHNSEDADLILASQIPDAVCRVALAIEIFHKASLVHDDIEDDDAFRYGQPTLHRTLGLPTAINVGDYLIGLGYRLVSRERASLGAEAAGEILDRLADAHLRLSEGQGAELLWRDARDKQLSPLDALDIYALKTAPAFEAALLCGLRCAAPLGSLERPLKQLSRHLGIAFQILNDLKDWQGDQDNKLASGLDILGGRPTLLWALALESFNAEQRAELLRIVGQRTNHGPQYGHGPHNGDGSHHGDGPQKKSRLAASRSSDADRIARVKQLFQQADVFEQASQLVEKHQQQAEAIADDVEPDSLRQLLYYLINTMLLNEEN
jgi:geranylgeranyl pyrophosphate synthase